ncbi:MAG TPA: condensation domain-containing protein, partial [Longimicrobium sp.]|nr:condensation domain-containing protein [Longimicrobium sp.]
MTELADRLAKLTPAQRRLLELRRAQQSGAAPAAAPAAIPARGEGPAPLSFAQERLWFLDRMEPGNAFYNLPNAVRMRGALDVPALERALGEIVRRHEALRTVFAEADGSPVQVIAPFGGFALPVEDLSGLGEAVSEVVPPNPVATDAQIAEMFPRVTQQYCPSGNAVSHILKSTREGADQVEAAL